MPWCDDCSKFWNPSSLPPTGECPTCGRVLSPVSAGRGPAADQPVEPVESEDYRAPWHFKLMVALAVVYLSWRLVQLITWIV